MTDEELQSHEAEGAEIEDGAFGASASQIGKYSHRPTGGNMLGPGTRNGRIPLSSLRRCVTQPTSLGSRGYLIPDGSICFDKMVAAAKPLKIALITGYRDYASQVRMKKAWSAKGKPGYAATPGYSNHGWASACDLNVRPSGVLAWMRKNGHLYGWDVPSWADDNRGTEEDWHFAYVQGFKPSDCPSTEPLKSRIHVTVNGILIPADGFLAGGVSTALARPVLEALGASFDLPKGGKLPVRWKGVVHQLPVTVTDGLSRLRLKDLEKLGLNVHWNPDTRTVEVTS